MKTTIPSIKFISAEELRTRKTRHMTGTGWSDWKVTTDLRGAPIGDRVQVWEFDRLVLPRRTATRRTRQHVKIMHCPEGWHSDSGIAERPTGPALCSTFLSGKWTTGDLLDRDGFKTFHEEYPVTWMVQVTMNSRRTTWKYCDMELPAEWGDHVRRMLAEQLNLLA